MKFQSWRFDLTRVCGILRRLGLIPGLRETNSMNRWTFRSPSHLTLRFLSTLVQLSFVQTTVASSVTYYFEGRLNDPFGTLGVGTAFSGSFSYDESQPTNASESSPYRASYSYQSLTVTFGAETVTDYGSGQLLVLDHGLEGSYPPDQTGRTTGYPTDFIYVYPIAANQTLGGLRLSQSGFSVCLQDLSGFAISSPAIPSAGLTLANFTTGNATFLQLSEDSYAKPMPAFARGELTYLSSEPGSDCNGDGIVDYGQIQRGELEDLNNNGVPDICETSITSVLPPSVPSQGGTTITIRGNGFPANPTVLFGGVPATNVVRESLSRITATSPAVLPGLKSVSVNGFTLPDGIYIRPECGSDLDQNGVVDTADISIILLDFGPCYEPPSTLAAPAPTPLLVPDEATPAPTPPAPQSARPTPQPRGTAS